MTAKNITYYSPTGRAMYGGRVAPGQGKSAFTFDSVTALTTSTVDPSSKALVLSLHGSGGANYTTGRRFEAMCSGRLAYDIHTKFIFSTATDTDPTLYKLRPVDAYSTFDANGVEDKRESMWIGFRNMTPETKVRLITEHRLDALVDWALVNIPHLAGSLCCEGGSMGGWGSVTYGLRRPQYFAAVYPDRPRWSMSSPGKFAVSDYAAGGTQTISIVNTPMIVDEDGGGTYYDYVNMIAYINNPANKLPWVGWCVGRQDGYADFGDQILAVNALRATKRGFAFAWNNGNHSTGSIMDEIRKSYPRGLFRLGKGYPLFTEHSLDKDPNVDLVGGINIGLTFRNVVETTGGWSCEVSSVVGACTVKVEPKSDIFKAAVTAQLVTIPAANAWVPVSFTA